MKSRKWLPLTEACKETIESEVFKKASFGAQGNLLNVFKNRFKKGLLKTRAMVTFLQKSWPDSTIEIGVRRIPKKTKKNEPKAKTEKV